MGYNSHIMYVFVSKLASIYSFYGGGGKNELQSIAFFKTMLIYNYVYVCTFTSIHSKVSVLDL